MRYVSFKGDTNLPAMEATYFMEIDERNNMVVRQIETVADHYLWGEWTGSEMVGDITDQPFSPEELKAAGVAYIERDVFESVWQRAKNQ